MWVLISFCEDCEVVVGEHAQEHTFNSHVVCFVFLLQYMGGGPEPPLPPWGPGGSSCHEW